MGNSFKKHTHTLDIIIVYSLQIGFKDLDYFIILMRKLLEYDQELVKLEQNF